MGDEEKEMFDMRLTTIRMAIALSAATIGSATVESEVLLIIYLFLSLKLL